MRLSLKVNLILKFRHRQTRTCSWKDTTGIFDKYTWRWGRGLPPRPTFKSYRASPLSWPASSAHRFSLYKPSTSPSSWSENGKQSRHQQTYPPQISHWDGIGRSWTMKHYGTETQGRIFSAQMKDGSLTCMWKFFSSGDRAEPSGVITQLGIYSLRCDWKGLLRLDHWSLSAMPSHVNYLQET